MGGKGGRERGKGKGGREKKGGTYESYAPVQVLLEIRDDFFRGEVVQFVIEIALHQSQGQGNLARDLQLGVPIGFAFPAPGVGGVAQDGEFADAVGRRSPGRRVVALEFAEEDVDVEDAAEAVFLRFEVGDPFEVFSVGDEVFDVVV